MGLRAMTSIIGVGALREPGRSIGRDPCHGSHPVVGGIVCMSRRSIFGRCVSYPLPPLCGVVSFVRRGTGMTPDWTEVIVVPSVLVRSVRRVSSCQSRHTEPRSISPHAALGVMMGERLRVFHVAKVGEGVMADPGLGIGSACSS